MKRAPDQTFNAQLGAVVLLLVAVLAGWVAGDRFAGNDGFGESGFDWTLALLAAGPFIVGACVFGAVSLLCRLLESRD
jgi:hypothetical protein